MSNVIGRNVVNSQYIFINSITVFYSRIIFRKIDLQTKQCFRNFGDIVPEVHENNDNDKFYSENNMGL